MYLIGGKTMHLSLKVCLFYSVKMSSRYSGLVESKVTQSANMKGKNMKILNFPFLEIDVLELLLFT